MKSSAIAKRIKRHHISRSKVIKEPIQVFCRVRPLPNPSDQACIQIIPPFYLQLVPPTYNRQTGVAREFRYTFKQIFDEITDQSTVFETVALPCIENVLHGKSGLIFTYGVSGSGKTYTMTGTNHDSGILPRSLDVIFNSISTRQVKKCTFVPDKLNSFDIQSMEDAKADRDRALVHKISATYKNKSKQIEKFESETDVTARTRDHRIINIMDEDNCFAVFVTYVEIYNNTVYDLLEDIYEENPKPKPLQSKIVREDSNHNMFVHGINEVEVGSTDEAFEVYYKGQKRKKMAQTSLNSESSRSHSVFTIRIVQAPLDETGENVINDRSCMVISQLSLVDLAGSERTNRTKNTGQRLREAGNINNSLLTLRMCIEIMRENQKGGNKVVPYRDSRLTHLFKNFFEGEGQVSMILCITPHVDDLEELMHVLKFAEMTKEVQICTPTTSKKTCFTSGRKRYKNSDSDVEEQMSSVSLHSRKDAVSAEDMPSNIREVGLSNIQTQGILEEDSAVEGAGDTREPPKREMSPFSTQWYRDIPDTRFIDISDNEALPNLINYLEESMSQFENIKTALRENCIEGKNKLVNLIRDSSHLTQELNNVKNLYQCETEKVINLENKAMSTDTEIIKMKKRIEDYEMNVQRLQKEVSQKEIALSKTKMEKEKFRDEFKQKMIQEQDRLNREFERKLRSQNSAFKYEMRNKEKKLKAVKRILATDDMSDSGSDIITKKKPPSESETVKTLSTVQQNPCPALTTQSPTLTNPVAVSNRRHRRSKSAGNDIWLDHRPKHQVPIGTLMQPTMAKKKSVTKLTVAKDVTENASKYCLLTQQQDSEGDLETRLYKGDVIPTAGGGAQVLFNDVEILRQMSPTSLSPVKRPAEIRKKFEEYCAASSIEKTPRI
ncbi:kinesin-like protein KIF23 isoform X2 [Cimex lectularius]|uniref:Kinesin-like protein n=1 Tax=Cimex lectularius TaxID=79782 RepID=A0A8I6RW76_CIMLE|nr:kinesin-like protein KIF23 isoform X2 [Cimex lectularius]